VHEDPGPAAAGPVREPDLGQRGCDPGGITELGRELLSCQVQKVTLESASDYWRIWYYVLESVGLAVQLVSASQAKNLKGRQALPADELRRARAAHSLEPRFE
jgi:transposase